MELPIELHYYMALHTSVESIFKLCQVNSFYMDLCNDNNFWRQKLWLDFPQFAPFKPNEITWKNAYVDIYKGDIKVIPIKYRNNIIGNVWINRNNTYREVYENILRIFEGLFPNQRDISVTALVGVPGEIMSPRMKPAFQPFWLSIQTLPVPTNEMVARAFVLIKDLDKKVTELTRDNWSLWNNVIYFNVPY